MRFGCFLLGVLACACNERAQLVVELHSDRTSAEGLLLTAAAAGSDGTSALREIVLGPGTFPLSFGLTSNDAPLGNGLGLDLELRDNNGVIAVAQRQIAPWTESQKRFVQICLSTRCDNTLCDATSSCGNAGCVAQLISSTDNLDPGFECGPPGVATDAGQPDGAGHDGGPDDAGPDDAGPNDAGPNDAGPNDSGPNDSGPNDSGPNDGPNDSGPNDGPNDSGPSDAQIADIGIPNDWRSMGSDHRIRLVLQHAGAAPITSGTVVRVVIDHADLVNQGLANPDGSDVRMFYQNTSIPISDGLDASTYNSSSTHLFFRLQSDLPSNSPDSDYHIYFGGVPMTQGSNTAAPSFRVRTREATNVALNQTSYRELLRLQLSRARNDERWMVIATWKLARNPGDPVSNALFALYEGPGMLSDARDLAVTQTEGGSLMSGSVIWYNGRQVGGPVIQLRGRLPTGGVPVTIDELRLVAFLLPRPPTPATDFIVDNAINTTIGTITNLAPLPSRSEERVWFARGAHNRAPSTVTSTLELTSNGGIFTASSGWDRLTTDLDSFLPVVHFDRLRAGDTTAFTHVSDASGSRRRGLGQMAVPTAWFASADFAGSGALTSFGGTATPYMNLPEQSYGALRDWVLLASARPVGSLDGEIRGELNVRVSGASVATSQIVMPNGWTSQSFVWADTGWGVARPALEVTGQRLGPREFEARHGSLVGLSYRDPLATFSAIETHP